MTTTERVAGLNGSVGFKAPCRAATTAAVTLSGEQTVDGVAIVSGDRVLVKNQSSGVDNGIYTASTGAWSRALDFNGSRDARNGTLVYVTDGTANGSDVFAMSATDPVTIGTTAVTFTAVINLTSASAYIQTLLDDADAATAQTTLGGTTTGKALFTAESAAAALATLSGAGTGSNTFTGKQIGKAFDADAITSVASATTTNIGAAATSEVLITGTTPISGFGTANAGIRRRGRFSGILTLAYNATSMILPGGVNITTAANDTFDAVSLGSGNWHVTSYVKASGLALTVASVTGRIVQGPTTVASSSAFVAASGATNVTLNDTAPTSSTGDQFLTGSFTPTSASSTLKVTLDATFSNTANNGIGVVLLDGSTVLRYWLSVPGTLNFPAQRVMTHTFSAGSTSAKTLSVRAFSVGGSSTIQMNGASGARLGGGQFVTSLVVEEVL